MKRCGGWGIDSRNNTGVKKKKLVWQIFPLFLLLVFVSLAPVAWYSTVYFKKLYLDTSEQELTARAKLVRQIISSLGATAALRGEADEISKKIGEETGTRVTIILPSGEVIADSFGDTATMENHRNRPEIVRALEQKRGVSIRYSRTLDQDMMYIALPVAVDGHVSMVVRTAFPVSSIDREIRAIRYRIFWTFGVMVLVSAVVSLLLAWRIVRPIETMKDGAVRFAEGELSTRLEIPSTEELSELAKTMNIMAARLDEKITAFKNRSNELEAVHSSMKEGVIAIDNDERIITVNDAAARVFRLPVQSLNGRFVLEVVRNLSFQGYIKKALAESLPVEEDIVFTQDKDVILNIYSTALYDSENNRMGTLIIFHDITRMRRLENMHKDFAANVSHELKTPMTSIKGFVETLAPLLETSGPQEAVSFLNIIKNNVDRLICLVDDLLALSRLERMEGTDTAFEVHHMLSLINSSVSSCRGMLEKKEMAVDIDCPDDLTVRVDLLLMEQALTNIVDNAVKYSDPMGNISITAATHDRGVVIRIRDTGPGIAPAHLTKIFNRFYRVDRARSRQEGGTGLGLAIVKHIVQYHKGTVSVSSRPGHGSTFEINLPGIRI